MNGRLERLWHMLDGERRAFVVQLLRYGIAGVGVTLFQIAIYDGLLGFSHPDPLIANTLATAAAMLLGYTVHSRFSFRGHGSRGNVAKTGGRFFIANLLGYALNSLWVWSIAKALHLDPRLASIPMICLTPVMLFWLNRRWVFE